MICLKALIMFFLIVSSSGWGGSDERGRGAVSLLSAKI